MSSVESLRAQQNRKRAELQKQQDNRATMEGEISRLKEAKKQVQKAQEEAVRIFKDAKNQANKYGEWKGKESDWFSNFVSGQFQSNCQNYSSKLQQLYGRISDKITQLQNKCLNTGGLINTLMGAINSLGNEIDKLVNGWRY